jgi:hypothetical protein
MQGIKVLAFDTGAQSSTGMLGSLSPSRSVAHDEASRTIGTRS